VISGAARYSPLIWRLYGKKLAFTDYRNPYKAPIRQMPPGKGLPAAERKLFVEWVDVGAQWDNLPGEDDLPGYDADQSRRLAAASARAVREVISDPAEAFRIRCFECHDQRRVGKLVTMPHSQVPATIQRMVAKRRGWIHDQELPLITQHIYKAYPKGKGK
jgi:hypothetical protein